MVEVPAPTMVTVFPEIVATAVLLLVNVTVKPEEEVADKVKAASPKVFTGMGAKVIVCGALPLTVRVWATSVAAE